MRVKNLKIREIFATNSQKTIEIELETLKGKVRSSVPIGTSKGKYEVKYLPTEAAIRKFDMIKRHFTTEDFSDIESVDTLIRVIDKTEDLREIGGNLALAISSAFLKSFALNEGKEVFEYLAGQKKELPTIPRPISIVCGGWKESRSDIQEFHLLPVHQTSFMNSVDRISYAYLVLGQKLKEIDPIFNYGKNLESGWVTSLQFGEVLNILKSIANENLLKIGLDLAASQLWDGNQYYVYRYSNKFLTRTEQLDLIRLMLKKFPIIYVEDPFEENDFLHFSVLNHESEGKIIAGDDLYATNLKRLKFGLESKATSGIIIKPNQVGTISDVLKVVEFAKKNKMITIVSHRSAETDDTLICHLAVGLNCNYIKLGISGEGTIKINEMLRIEEKLNSKIN
jgi:enolase